MDREKLHRKIDELATLISVNNNRMMLHEERIPQLDIDLLRKNAIQLYEEINLLHIQNLKDKRSAVLLESASGYDEEIRESPAPEVKAPEQEVPEEPVNVTPPAPKPPEPEPEPVAEKFIEEETKDEPEPEQEKPVKPVEKAEDKPGKPHLHDKLKRTSIESIKKSISISKRYEMQSALFKNDPDAYNETISKLDGFDEAKSALDYLQQELKTRYNWNDEDPLVEELYLLVERRYS